MNDVPSLTEMAVRGWRILISPWAGGVVLLALLIVTAAYQSNVPTTIQLGGGYDLPYLNSYDLAFIDSWAGGFGDEVRFDPPAADSSTAGDGESSPGTPVAGSGSPTAPEAVRENYRWTRARPILLLPGVGRAADLDLRAAASPALPAGQHLEVLVNGQPHSAFDLLPGIPVWQHLDLGSSPDGNFTVEMRVTPRGAADPHIQVPTDGFKLYQARITPRSDGLLPPPGKAVVLALIGLTFYAVLAYLGLARRYAAGLAAVGLILAGVVLIQWRLALTVYTNRLLLLLLVALLTVIFFDWLLPRVFQRMGLLLPRALWRGLLALFVIGLLLRGGGVLYPQMVVIDAPAHLLEIWRVAQGQLWQQYTNHVLSRAPGHWQSSVMIPYSTISYFLLAPLARLPVDMHISINLVNILLDAGRVFIIYVLGRALGLGRSAAVVGAGLYLLLPCTWLLNSWGNWPTTISLWLASLYLALVLWWYPQLSRRSIWLGVTALLTLTMLVYSVTAVFMGLLLAIWGGALVVLDRTPDRRQRRSGLLLLASALGAAVAAVLIYYWQFVPDILASLPLMAQSVEAGPGLGVQPTSFGSYASDYLNRLFIRYGVGLLLLPVLAFVGWALVARGAPQRLLPHDEPATSPPAGGLMATPASRWFVGAWFAVFVVFGFIGWKVDMVDKQIWFVVPLVCALAGGALLLVWQQIRQPLLRTGGRLAIVALTGWLTYSAGALWFYRIFIKRH